MVAMFSEVKIDHKDVNGVIHIDGFVAGDPDEEATNIGYFMPTHSAVYWCNDEYQFCLNVIKAVQILMCNAILDRKKNGQDCTEEESGIVKKYLNDVYGEGEQLFRDLSFAFQQEYTEMYEERLAETVVPKVCEWEVPVTRISYSFKTLTVKARTEEEAIEMANEQCGDELFSENESEYKFSEGATKK